MDHIHTHYALKWIIISCFCIWRCFGKTKLENMFWKIQFLSWAKYFQVTKIVQSFITCLDFVQACLFIKVYWLNYFCRFLCILWDFIWAKKTNFLIPEKLFQASDSRLIRNLKQFSGIKKLVFLAQIKFHKILKNLQK